MSTHGIRVKDATETTTLLLTPSLFTLVSAGRVDMPAALVGDLYGYDVSLGSTYNAEDIGVLAMPFVFNVDAILYALTIVDTYAMSWYMHDTFTFYTRDESTGEMTEWTPDVTPETDYDPITSIYPVAFWDKRGATTFSTVSIFAAMCYEVYDTSAATNIKVYAVADEGVEHVDYAIYVRNYTGL